MAVQTFPQFLVIDEQGNAAAGATVQAFDLIDTSFATPLTVTDLNGLPLVLVSNGRGMIQSHRVNAASGVVVYRSGSMPPQPILSLDSVVAAATAAAASADDAEASRIAAEAAASGGGGGGGGVTAHGALTGLGNDDHPQYHTDARGDARYPLKSAVTTEIGNAVAASSGLDRQRANHTGTQAISTVAGLQAILDGFGGTAVNTVNDLSGNVVISVTNLVGTGVTGRTVMGAANEAAARTAIGAAPTSHTHTDAQISNATATGRGLLTAADAAAARGVIGAGTSSLELGTTGTTALRGNAIVLNPSTLTGLPVGTFVART